MFIIFKENKMLTLQKYNYMDQMGCGLQNGIRITNIQVLVKA